MGPLLAILVVARPLLVRAYDHLWLMTAYRSWRIWPRTASPRCGDVHGRPANRLHRKAWLRCTLMEFVNKGLYSVHSKIEQ